MDAKTVISQNIEEYLYDVDGILIPEEFGKRAIEGKETV